VAAKIIVSSGNDNKIKVKIIDLGSFFNNDTKISCPGTGYLYRGRRQILYNL